MSPLTPQRKKGFSLVEVTMAIGLMSFCLVALIGVLPVGFSQERKSSDQMLSLQALTAVAADFKNWDISKSATSKYEMHAGAGTVLELDENLNRLTDPGSTGVKQFHVTYTIEKATSRFANTRLSVRVARSNQTTPTNEQNLNYVESVVLKPAS